MPTSLTPTQFGIRLNFPFFDRLREGPSPLDSPSFPGKGGIGGKRPIAAIECVRGERYSRVTSRSVVVEDG